MLLIKKIYRSELFYFLLFTLSIFVCLVYKKNEFLVPDLIALVIAIYSAIRILIIDKLINYKKDINNFEVLHNEMTKEMNRLLNSNESNLQLYILSFTPAFGNISAPELYENDENQKFTYKYLLENIVTKGISVKIICFNEQKRREYHRKWADIFLDKDKMFNANAAIIKWEKQAQEIIRHVRSKLGHDAVNEVSHLHPILYFSTNNILIQYAIKMDGSTSKSIISGTMVNQKNKIGFYNESFDEYYKTHVVFHIFEKYLIQNETVRKSTEKVIDILKGEIASNNSTPKNIDVLLAYGGGKDSTLALIFFKYLQERILKDKGDTFTLHVIVHIHPGMTDTVLKNIHRTLNVLKLNKDKNVNIEFYSKTEKLNWQNFVISEFSTENIVIPGKIVNDFRREILLLGHLSAGLGRQTFCYTCNFDMIMTIINYAINQERKIDYIVTGDSKKEKEMYYAWLTPLFKYVNNKSSIGKKEYNSKAFFSDFTALNSQFNKEILLKTPQNKNQISAGVGPFPKLFEINKYVDFNLSNNIFREMLENELGFIFGKDSFNFSETDCFYPAIMAHLAGLRAPEGEYKTHLNIHLEHALEIMSNKGFPKDLIENVKSDYYPNIKPTKRNEIEKFLEEQIRIDKEMLNSLVFSPFLNGAERLQDFLNIHSTKFNKDDVISYLNGDNNSDDIKEFISNHIGLTEKDIRHIMFLSSNLNQKDNKLLQLISGNDPYVKKVKKENGDEVIVSGR